jgi:hypothetical protein
MLFPETVVRILNGKLGHPYPFKRKGLCAFFLLLSSPRSKIFGSEFVIRRLNQINMEN